MDTLTSDPFKAARLILTLRQNGITDDALLRFVETTDRGAFADPIYRNLAFQDAAIPLSCGHSILRPVVMAQLLQAARLKPTGNRRILFLAEGSGYAAALLAERCEKICMVERYRGLVETVQKTTSHQGLMNVMTIHANPEDGWREQAPFERIIVFRSLSQPIPALIDQLSRDGRLVFPTEMNGQPRVQCVSADRSSEFLQLTQRVPALGSGLAQVL